DGVQRLVDQARAASGVVYTRVLDRQGLLLAAAGQRPATAARGTSLDRTAPIDVGVEVWEFRAAIVRAGRETPAAALGTAAVRLSLEPLHELQRRRLTTATVFAPLSALIGVPGSGVP